MRRASKRSPVAAWRFYSLLGFLLILLVLLVGRVLSLQVLDTDRGHEFLQGQGEMRAVRTTEIPAYRGVISDRHGEPLAVSTPVVSIWANPALLKMSGRLPALASALGVPLEDLEDKLERFAKKQFMYLKRHQVPGVARKILEMRISGVYGEREYQRFYPAGEVTAHVVGFTNLDDEGITGLELAYEDWLRGEPGKKKIIKDLHGDVVRDIGVVRAASPGRDLVLSIDLRLQYLQHSELQRAMTITGAESGTIVTLDSRTGEILAMVNSPVYNPNNRSGVKLASMRNRAVTDVYEPGSTMKPLTVAAAIETGLLTTQSIIDTAPGRIRVGRKTLQDPRNYGEISVSRVLEKSSQVGITKIALKIGHEPIWNMFNRFGIGQPPGIGFPGESSGILPFRSKWHEIEKVTLAFGYGLTASPLQLAHAYTVFANEGVQPQLSLLALQGQAAEGRVVIAPEVAEKILHVLQRVTGEHGTAKKALVPGYQVGGKTGTVHKVGPGGYVDDQYVALFVGVAPIENPRIVTAVILNQPKGDSYGGGSAAAPVFSRVTAGALRLLNVAPSEPESVIALGALRREGAV
jgi:cell division protein FtsI (penicillin-binding protein 3)